MTIYYIEFEFKLTCLCVDQLTSSTIIRNSNYHWKSCLQFIILWKFIQLVKIDNTFLMYYATCRNNECDVIMNIKEQKWNDENENEKNKMIIIINKTC